MGYLVQKTRAASLTVGGQDYTSSFVSLQVSDVSAFKNGLITTSGTLLLGQRPGGVDIEDYDRNLFKRGTLITLDVQEPGGATYRHPRGHLYVLGLAYNVEAEQLDIQVGCRLSLAYLTDNTSEVLPLVPIPLDPTQRTIENCSASFASAGMILYQDNQGALQSRRFFGNDDSSGVDGGDWVSVLGQTALSVSPLAGAGPIPDTIKLSYQVPAGAISGDQDAITEDTTVTESNYFISYPAVTFARVKQDENDSNINERVNEPPRSPVRISGCGTVIEAPQSSSGQRDGEQQSQLCNEAFVTERTTVYLPANKVVTSTSYYLGVGGQISRSEEEESGPLIEANSQYFADRYAFCKQIYGYSCRPSGGCQYYGMQTSLLRRTVVEYFYNTDGSLASTVQDTYETMLSAANPEDWRSGVSNGRLQGFDQQFDTRYNQLYLATKVITNYRLENNLNVQETITFNSVASRGIGVSGLGSSYSVQRYLDATQGIKTVVIRKSATNVVNDPRPDSVKSPSTSTSERSTLINLNTNSYITPPSEAANYQLEESIPVPLLSSSSSTVQGWVADYSNYLVRFTKGGLYGLQIGESMRSEIVTGWYPGRPFRYADNKNNRIAAMRMDACAWGVTQEEAIVVMNGVWNGFSIGTLVLGDNLTGNSSPDMSATPGAPTPPPGASAPPSIANDVVGQSFSFNVDINLQLDSHVFIYGDSPVRTPNPTDLTARVDLTIIPHVGGIVVEPGGIVETTGTGAIPFETNDGLIVTTTAVVVTDDLFAAAP